MRLSRRISVLIMIFAGPTMAATLPDCAIDKYRLYTEAQRTWQHGLTQLVVDAAPEYKDLLQAFLGATKAAEAVECGTA